MSDRLPPFNLGAEQALLGCILLDPTQGMNPCLEAGIAPSSFYDLRHQTIYEAMVALYGEGKMPDSVTVAGALRDFDVSYLAQLPDFAPTAFNIAQYIQEVADKATLRLLIRHCTDYAAEAYDSKASAQEIIERFENASLKLVPNKGGQMVPIKELVRSAIDDIEKMHQRQGLIDGISYGFSDLDRATGGLHPGEMTVLAGYPGSGKTAIAMNIVEAAAVDQQQPVGVFSLEMNAKSLVMRLLCSRARVNPRNVRDGFLPERDVQKLTLSSSKIANSNIHIEDISDLSVVQLRAKARRMAQEHGIRLFVIDYLQLLSAVSGSRGYENRQQEVADISRGVKGLAKELNVPVIALSQLNDDGKLRESRAIGQDADNVMVLEVDDTEEEERFEESRRVNLIIRKQRNGPSPVSIPLIFLKQYTRFELAARVSTEDVLA